MDERREPEADPGTQRAVTVGRGQLPAPQDAWRLYVEHWNACTACKNVDGGACEESTRLYLSWQGIAGDALRDVSTGRRGRY